MNWLPITQMGHGLLSIDLRINQSLGQSGSLPRSIVLMALSSTTRVDWCHLVTQGFSQHPGFEYLKLFTPTVCLPTLCIILELAAIHDLHLWSVDVSNAYLNGKMNCDVYMEQPKGFE